MLALDYHESTKHHFNRFARSLGYLDWASQPDPFRRFAGAELVELPRVSPMRVRPAPDMPDLAPSPPARSSLADTRFARGGGTIRSEAISYESIGEFLRCSLGLSAWKQYGSSRWALRVNPSSGNLHPTEGYVVTGDSVLHYAPRDHEVERRACLDAGGWLGPEAFLVGLSSIHWREAWKYGERAFRYCQHDAGHAIGALRIAAALLGWRLAVMPRWSHEDVAGLLGLDRDEDFVDGEREEPECVAIVGPGNLTPFVAADPGPLVAAARAGMWRGRANRLSTHHVEWPLIDAVAEATRFPGLNGPVPYTSSLFPETALLPAPCSRIPPRDVILRRRSALGFDARSTLPRDSFLSMLARAVPDAPPWDAIWWPPHLHLAIFVHRVEGLTPGVYMFMRALDALNPLRAACRDELLWEPVDGSGGRLFLLLPIDCCFIANRLSCDQDIAADGFFSLGMIARFEPSLRERGEWFYRNLFWESGLIGQLLYLEAEAAGARSTGIGCYYDDPVHELLGLSGRDWQSLYHFSAGMPVEDRRLTTEPGYAWEDT